MRKRLYESGMGGTPGALNGVYAGEKPIQREPAKQDYFKESVLEKVCSKAPGEKNSHGEK